MKNNPYRYISYPQNVEIDISKIDIDDIQISFTQKGHDSYGRFGYKYGWIDISLKWNNNEITLSTSSIYSPYKSLVIWIENINRGKLPCQFDIDEYDIFKLTAYPVDNKELFYLVIENTCDKDNKIYLEGLFNRGIFVAEFCDTFAHFLATEYNNEYWTDNDEDDLRKLIPGKLTGDFNNELKYTCPCCGYKTLAELDNYDLCPICYWEDDSTQYENPDLEGGPNAPSLRQAQLNFILYGASDHECLGQVNPPSPWTVRDSTWLPLYQIEENIHSFQKEFEKNSDLPVNLFKSTSFLFFKDKLDRCRKDEDMAAPRAYGKNKIEKVYWRELFAEEAKAWAFFRGKEFQTGDEIIQYSKNTQQSFPLFFAILNDDKDGVIRRILDRALNVKNRLRKIGVSVSVKEMLEYAIHKACYLCDNQYKLDEIYDKAISLKKNPQTIYLPGFHSNKATIKELGLLKNPDKIKSESLVFKIAVLKDFLVEEVSVNNKDVKRLAMQNVKTFEFDPIGEFQKAFNAARIKDSYLFLKTIQKLWHKDAAFLISQKQALVEVITTKSLEWIVVEYELFCEENYSGLELGLECNSSLLVWLKANICIPKVMDMLHNGNIITNVVGMRYIEWAKYLRLDEYLNGNIAELVRDPNNSHDENAIAVETERFGRLGYIKRSVAKMLAPVMDDGVKLKAEIVARYYTRELDTTIFLKIKI